MIIITNLLYGIILMGISKNPNFLSIIANALMQGVTVQELQVASNGYNEAVVHLL